MGSPLVLKLGSGLVITQDKYKEAMRAINRMTRTDVMVGIPEEDALRDATPEDPNPPTNALLGYVHEHGDPSRNLPARPFLVPGVEESKEQWIKTLETAAILAFRGDEAGMRAALGRAGQRAVTAVQEVIRRQDFAPLAPSTIEERIRKIAVINPKLAEKYSKMSPSEKIQFESDNITILIDTGSMFRAITWVLRDKGSTADYISVE